jgi:hypothetical protein
MEAFGLAAPVVKGSLTLIRADGKELCSSPLFSLAC